MRVSEFPQSKQNLFYDRQCSVSLTEHFSKEGWSGAARQMDTNVVDRYP